MRSGGEEALPRWAAIGEMLAFLCVASMQDSHLHLSCLIPEHVAADRPWGQFMAALPQPLVRVNECISYGAWLCSAESGCASRGSRVWKVQPSRLVNIPMG